MPTTTRHVICTSGRKRLFVYNSSKFSPLRHIEEKEVIVFPVFACSYIPEVTRPIPCGGVEAEKGSESECDAHPTSCGGMEDEKDNGSEPYTRPTPRGGVVEEEEDYESHVAATIFLSGIATPALWSLSHDAVSQGVIIVDIDTLPVDAVLSSLLSDASTHKVHVAESADTVNTTSIYTDEQLASFNELPSVIIVCLACILIHWDAS